MIASGDTTTKPRAVKLNHCELRCDSGSFVGDGVRVGLDICVGPGSGVSVALLRGSKSVLVFPCSLATAYGWLSEIASHDQPSGDGKQD